MAAEFNLSVSLGLNLEQAMFSICNSEGKLAIIYLRIFISKSILKDHIPVVIGKLTNVSTAN